MISLGVGVGGNVKMKQGFEGGGFVGQVQFRFYLVDIREFLKDFKLRKEVDVQIYKILELEGIVEIL